MEWQTPRRSFDMVRGDGNRFPRLHLLHVDGDCGFPDNLHNAQRLVVIPDSSAILRASASGLLGGTIGFCQWIFPDPGFQPIYIILAITIGLRRMLMPRYAPPDKGAAAANHHLSHILNVRIETMNQSDFTDNLGRIRSLDGLRAVSIILVCIGHLKGTVGAPEILDGFHSPGSRFFFIISSFLITWMLLRELEKKNSIDFKRFFRDRIFRIFPAFYAYIGIGAVLAWAGWVQLNPGDLLHVATFTMNY